MANDEFPRVLAMYDYVARSEQELTFRAGDILVCTEMLSDDWFEGELEGSKGLIAAAYVRHVPEWRSLAAMKSPASVPSPQLTRRQPDGHPSPGQTRSRNGESPRVPRTAVETESQSLQGGASPRSNRDGPAHNALPGMRHGEVGKSVLQPAGSEDELIKPKPIPMQPDRPDLAKALQIRNQAARVGAPMKAGPNELARHLQQLKTKQSFKTRMTDDPATAELKSRLKVQKERQAQKDKEGELTELQRRMATIAQPPQ